MLCPEQKKEWMEVLRRCRQHDAYHLPWYHAQAERYGEAVSRLFVHEEGGHLIALPLLLRSLRSVRGLGGVPAGWQDATSVYGYGGPLSSRDVPKWVVRSFQAALAHALREEQVVTVFSRLHPLIPQAPLLDGLGLCLRTGLTVAIDLTLPPDAQRARFRGSCKHRINRLRRLGVSSRHDPEFHHLDDFIGIYQETMRRVGAASHLCFSPSYFHDLVAGGGPHVHLFVCLLEGRAIAATLFLECGDFVQYHLGGTVDEYVRLSPSKLLIDVARLWAHGRGRRALHLGGGTTGRPDDPLFHFKAGFSDRTYDFLTWRWVVNPVAYSQLLGLGARRNEEEGLVWASADYFPAYRAGTRPAPATFPEPYLATE
jgi:hypothetical protein